MTTLSKDEIERMAKESRLLDAYAPVAYFAHLCRADLVAENERLRTALKNYANENNWDDDFHGTKRKWLEPDSYTRNTYAGFEIARAALKGEA